MVVAIDCNIFVICLTSRSPYHSIYQALINKKFSLVVSLEIGLEYEEIIQQKYRISTAKTFISLLKELPNVKPVYPLYKWNLIHGDPDDNKYTDCVIAGKADYLATEDSHFDVLRNITFPEISVINIDELLALVNRL